MKPEKCSQFSGGREMIFEGVDALADFCGWILGDDNKGVMCMLIISVDMMGNS